MMDSQLQTGRGELGPYHTFRTDDAMPAVHESCVVEHEQITVAPMYLERARLGCVADSGYDLRRYSTAVLECRIGKRVSLTVIMDYVVRKR